MRPRNLRTTHAHAIIRPTFPYLCARGPIHMTVSACAQIRTRDIKDVCVRVYVWVCVWVSPCLCLRASPPVVTDWERTMYLYVGCDLIRRIWCCMLVIVILGGLVRGGHPRIGLFAFRGPFFSVFWRIEDFRVLGIV